MSPTAVPLAYDLQPGTATPRKREETSLRQSRSGYVVVCVAPSPMRGNLRHDRLMHIIGPAMCLAGVGHTPIPSHPPPGV